MPNKTTLMYSLVSTAESTQNVRDSQETSQTKSISKFKILSEGANPSGNLVFIVSHESLKYNITGAMFDSTFLDPVGMVGKRVRKTIAPNGDQINSIEVDHFEPFAANPSFSSEQEFLTNLPNREIELHESVTFADIDTIHTFGGMTVNRLDAVYRLIGTEVKSGFDCLKLQIRGRISLGGNGRTQGMDFSLEGGGTVEGIIYFAPKEGVLVQSENHSRLELLAVVAGTENLAIPISQVTHSTLMLLD
jgi:hypothetical protein